MWGACTCSTACRLRSSHVEVSKRSRIRSMLAARACVRVCLHHSDAKHADEGWASCTHAWSHYIC